MIPTPTDTPQPAPRTLAEGGVTSITTRPPELDAAAITAIAQRFVAAINTTVSLFPFTAKIWIGRDRMDHNNTARTHVHIQEDATKPWPNPPIAWDWYQSPENTIGVRAPQSNPQSRLAPIADPFTPPPGSAALDRPVTSAYPITLSILPSGCVQINGTQSEARLAVILNTILPILREVATQYGELPAPKLIHPPKPSARLPRVPRARVRELVETIRPYKWHRYPQLTADIVAASGLDIAVQRMIPALETAGAVGSIKRTILSQIADFVQRQR